MSRFDELRLAFTLWHDNATYVRNTWMRFPAILAKKVQVYLGAPEQFADLSIDEKQKHYRYVSLATAAWNVDTQSFDLALKERGLIFNDFELNPVDGRFYFGLAIFLERSSGFHPKQPFWFLFSLGLEDQEHSSLRIQRTANTFSISHGAANADSVLDPLCEIVNRLLLEDLSTSPYALRAEGKRT